MVAIANYGFRKALIVTDVGLARAGVAERSPRCWLPRISNRSYLTAHNRTQPSATSRRAWPSCATAPAISSFLGGGSPHDCAKGIAPCATNGGNIADYEGVDRSAKPQLPLVAINTTAGTASEMTRCCIITDEARHVKMAIVDRNVTPLLSVNDPALMVAMPKG